MPHYLLTWTPRPNSKRHVLRVTTTAGQAVATFFHMRDAVAWCEAQS